MAMACGSSTRQSIYLRVMNGVNLNVPLSSPSLIPISIYHNTHPSPVLRNNRFHLTAVPKASPGSGGLASPTDDDGVSLGTMKLPINTDLQRFDSLLFQVKMLTNLVTYKGSFREINLYLNAKVLYLGTCHFIIQ